VPEDFRLIVDLVLVLAAATIGGLLASLLRQPAILGYLIGGIIVGPGGLGVIKELIQVKMGKNLGIIIVECRENKFKFRWIQY
jgi:CPA2 family monovalent cation:H+ antiporter-2